MASNSSSSSSTGSSMDTRDSNYSYKERGKIQHQVHFEQGTKEGDNYNNLISPLLEGTQVVKSQILNDEPGEKTNEKYQHPVLDLGSEEFSVDSPGNIIIVQPVRRPTKRRPPSICSELSFFACDAYCPHCKEAVLTKPVRRAGNATVIASAILCLLGCILCAWVPFCMDDLKDVDHYCCICDAYLGRRKFTC